MQEDAYFYMIKKAKQKLWFENCKCKKIVLRTYFLLASGFCTWSINLVINGDPMFAIYGKYEYSLKQIKELKHRMLFTRHFNNIFLTLN